MCISYTRCYLGERISIQGVIYREYHYKVQSRENIYSMCIVGDSHTRWYLGGGIAIQGVIWERESLYNMQSLGNISTK